MRSRQVQRGVGLVELMVAMLLGALVVIGVIQVFTANKQTFRMQDAMALTQETGTFALDFMGRDLLRAGFPGFPQATNAFDWDFTLDGGPGGNDRLGIVYGPDAAGGVFCTGEDAGAALRIANWYWVEDGQLKCRGAIFDEGLDQYVGVGTEQVLADNVESFQVLFGVDLSHDRDPVIAAGGGCADSPQEPTAYIRQDRVQAALDWGSWGAGTEAAPALPACKGPMDELEVVRSVRIALLMRTPNSTDVVVDPAKTYTVLDEEIGAPAIDPADGRLRRLFAKTISLRNVGEVVE